MTLPSPRRARVKAVFTENIMVGATKVERLRKEVKSRLDNEE